MQTTLTPYLMFHHNCREAMSFYQSCLGGTLTLSTYVEAGTPCPEDQKNLIIHASLVADAITIVASDWSHEVPVYTLGNNVHLSIGGSNEAQLRAMFIRLSSGGTIKMLLEKQFWGDTFGSFVDQFGIHWMVNITKTADEV